MSRQIVGGMVLALMLLPLCIPLAFVGFRKLGQWNRRGLARTILLTDGAVFGLYLVRFKTGRGNGAGMDAAVGALGMFALMAVIVLSIVGWVLGAAERRAG